MVQNWALGVMMNISGSVIINLGTNLMKLGHNKRQASAEQKSEVELARAGSDLVSGAGGVEEGRVGQTDVPVVSPHASLASKIDPRLGVLYEWLKARVWGVGAFLLVFGSVLNFVSFSFASQAMLAGLGSVQFVSNVVFVRFVLGERITKKTIVATIVILGGQVLVILFSPHNTTSYDVRQLKRLWVDGNFVAYLIVLSCLLVALAYTYWSYSKSEIDRKPRPYSHIVRPTTYAVFSAIIGTKSVLQAKCLSELLKSTLKGNNQMGFVFTYVVLFLWLGFTVFWLNRMNTSLKHFDGVFIIPVLQVFWTFFAVLDGFMYFQDYRSYTAGRLLGFISGVLIIFYGVYLLCPDKDDKSPKDASKEERAVEESSDEKTEEQSRITDMIDDLKSSAVIANDTFVSWARGTGLLGCNNNDDVDETLLTPGSLRSTNIVAPYSPSVTSVDMG